MFVCLFCVRVPAFIRKCTTQNVTCCWVARIRGWFAHCTGCRIPSFSELVLPPGLTHVLRYSLAGLHRRVPSMLCHQFRVISTVPYSRSTSPSPSTPHPNPTPPSGGIRSRHSATRQPSISSVPLVSTYLAPIGDTACPTAAGSWTTRQLCHSTAYYDGVGGVASRGPLRNSCRVAWIRAYGDVGRR